MATDIRETTGFYLNDPAKLDNPFPDMAYFRAHKPVFFYAPVNEWFVFGYDDVTSLFADPRLSANRMKGFVDAAPAEVRDDIRPLVPYFDAWVLMKDGADHMRVRELLNVGFSVEAVRALHDIIERGCHELLDRVQGKGRLDVGSEYGFLLPVYVLSDFLGVKPEDRERVVEWSVNFIDFFNIIPITMDTTRRMVASAHAMLAYTHDLLAAQRSNPRDDLLGKLLQASVHGQRLTDEEIAGNVMLLLLAGHVAVRNLIGNTVWLLLTHPDQLALLRARPELLPSAIEESLRVEPPVCLLPRIALEDFDLHGNQIKAGQIVQLSVASANRDAAHFPDPDRFDITRQPKRILSFGYGPHGCLGGHLAREIASIALTTLFQRLPNLQLDTSTPIKWYRNAANRGPIELYVTF